VVVDVAEATSPLTGRQDIAYAPPGVSDHVGWSLQTAGCPVEGGPLAKTACCPTKDRGQGKEAPAVAICATLRAPRC
jgi:hypothetical protein